jgi:flagellar motor component MotA
MFEKSVKKITNRLIGVLVALVVLMFLYLVLDPNSYASDLLLDQSGKVAEFPFTVQTLLWLIFFVGLADSVTIFQLNAYEKQSLAQEILPESKVKMISEATAKGLIDSLVRRGLNQTELGQVVNKTLLIYLSTGAVERSLEMLRESIEVVRDRNLLAFDLLRYISWLLPTLGFIGTVIGISLALEIAGNPPIDNDRLGMRDWMGNLTANLGIAFSTTLLALAQSAVIVFLQTSLQTMRDDHHSNIHEYCLDRLVNKLLPG